MELRADTRLDYPLDVVYEAYRDKLPECEPWLPDIKKIDVLERREEGDKTFLLNEWHADTDIPKVAQAIVKPDMLRWKDHAEWENDKHIVHWRMELAFMNDQVTTHGTNRFEADGDGTWVRIRGVLEIDGTNIPGVPKFVGKKIAPQLEKFVISLIKPNLIKTADAVGEFLESQK